ncbi:MAG TPA: hypothetical protein VD997_13170 [Phycisphaerales bacterium]|nr:hypothetical protein [Phycisphaerales bacterium]
MAEIIPASKTEMVNFVRDHLNALKANAVALGLTTALTTQLETQLDKTETDEDAMNTARLASRAATGTFDVSCTTLRAIMQQCIDRIRIQAESTANPNLWNVAMLPAPQPPTPAGEPTPGEDVVADPNADGTVTIKWKGSTAHGQFFTVWRRVGDNGAWSQIGSIAGRVRSFVDGGVPSPVTTGGASLFYMVRGQRGNQVSKESNFGVIQYGAGPGFTFTASSGVETSGKLAA